MIEPLVLKDIYSLGDLLGMVGKALANQQLRLFRFVFYPRFSYSIEFTDARTMRLRYAHHEENHKQIMSYVDVSQQDVLMRDVEKDIRSVLSQLKTVHTSGQIELYLPADTKPILYKIRPGGYSYIRKP